jgi:hypothetical protein
MPRSIISFGFKDSSIVNGFKTGTAFRGLSKTGHIETFFLAETKAGAETETEAGITLAMETFGTTGTIGVKARTETGVTLAIETFGIVGTGTETGTETDIAYTIDIARTIRIIGMTETGAEVEMEVALGIKASYARLNKNSI